MTNKNPNQYRRPQGASILINRRSNPYLEKIKNFFVCQGKVKMSPSSAKLKCPFLISSWSWPFVGLRFIYSEGEGRKPPRGLAPDPYNYFLSPWMFSGWFSFFSSPCAL